MATTNSIFLKARILDAMDWTPESLREALRTRPELAREKFHFWEINDDVRNRPVLLYPLMILLCHHGEVDLNIIEEVYALYPEALRERQCRQGRAGRQREFLPLHHLLGRHSSDEIFQFVLSKYPLAAAQSYSSIFYRLPLHNEVGHLGTRRTSRIKALVDAYPNAIAIKAGAGVGYPGLPGTRTPLQVAFELLPHNDGGHGIDTEAVAYMFDRCPRDMDEFSVGLYYGKRDVVDLDRAKLLDKILPQLKLLHCVDKFKYKHTQECSPAFTSPAFVYLMEQLQEPNTASNLQDLEIALAKNDKVSANALEQFLGSKTCSLVRFDLYLNNRLHGDSILECIARGLVSNRTLKRLSITAKTGFKFSNLSYLERVFEDHNDTLEEVHIKDRSSSQRPAMCRIRYYCELNRYGRAKIRRATPRGADLVEMLEAAGSEQTASRSSRNSCSTHAIQYGLLRESPSIWCHQEVS